MTDVTANRLLSLLRDIEQALPTLVAQPAVREVGSHVRSSGFGSRPPGDLAVLDLLWEQSNRAVLPKLWEWAAEIQEKRFDAGLPWDQVTGTDLTAVCVYLRSRVVWVVEQDWADELQLEWAEMRAHLRRAPGSGLSPDVLERVPCTTNVSADGTTCAGTVITRLRSRGDQVTVTSRCDTCATVYTDGEMTELIADRDATREAQRQLTVTAADAVTHLAARGVHTSTEVIRKWGVRGALAKHPLRGKERTYLLSEVTRLAEHAQSRTHKGRSGRTVPGGRSVAP